MVARRRGDGKSPEREPRHSERVSSTSQDELGGAPCIISLTNSAAMKTATIVHFFETMSKRRRGFPSETHVKRGVRVVHGDKLLEEKLGRNDPCPCGSGKRFKKCCLRKGRF